MKKFTGGIGVVALLMSLLLCGCREPPGLTGAWVDESGYMVQFTDSGEFVESTFALKMPYVHEGTGVMYYLPDGNAHYAEVDFDNAGNLLMHINDADRVFKSTTHNIVGTNWAPEQLPSSSRLQGKYILNTSLSVTAELRLLDTQQFSLAWASGSDKLPDWTKPGSNVQVGIFANQGVGSTLLLYTDAGNSHIDLKLSDSGHYAATYLLTGKLSKVETDYSSKVTTRGYLIAGTLYDEALGITYRFGADKTLTKTSKSGTSINYSYFVNDDGLLSMSCTDAVLPTDFMWVDADAGRVYRAVFERDNWTDYMVGTTLLSAPAVLPTDPSGTDGEPSQTIPAVSEIMRVIDEDTLVDLHMDISALLPGVCVEYGSDLEQAISLQEAKAVVSDWSSIQEQVEQIQVDMETRKAMEDAMLDEHREYIEAMHRIAEERKAAEEEQRLKEEQERLEGQSQPPVTPYIWQPPWVFNTQPPSPTPTTPGTGGGVGMPGLETGNPGNPGGNPGGNFGVGGGVTPTPVPTPMPNVWTPPQYTGGYGQSFGRFTVNWKCNCSNCHRTGYPTAHGSTLIADVDSEIVEEELSVVLGGSYNVQTTTVCSGSVQGYVINVYVNNHDWVAQQRSTVIDLYPAVAR